MSMEEILIEGSLIEMAHSLVESVVKRGDLAVDATMGNGHDTLFLMNCVGIDGKVIGFDVQQAAVDSTGRRLLDAGVDESNFDLHLVSHDQMAGYLSRESGAVMFNLGYLPGADKSLITQTEVTLDAMDAAVQNLRCGGILSVMCYPGHAGGDTEAQTVKEWFTAREGDFAYLSLLKRENASEKSPFLLVGVKKEA